MHRAYEDNWTLPSVPLDDRGALTPPSELWPGIRDGRDKPLHHRKTVAEYLEFEQNSEVKHEYVDGYVYAMAGASDAHATITLNIASAFKARLRGKKCRTYASDMRVTLGDVADESKRQGQYYYPDVLVTCSDRDRESSMDKRDPSLVVEVLSKSTGNKDRTEKLDNYRQLPSLAQYWIVDQYRRHVIVHSEKDGEWTSVELSSGTVRVALPSGIIEIPLDEIYEEVLGLE